MTDKKPEEKQDPPPEFISEALRIEIEANGSALDTFTGRTLTSEDLEAYNKAQADKTG